MLSAGKRSIALHSPTATVLLCTLVLLLLSMGIEPSRAGTNIEPVKSITAKGFYPAFAPAGADYAIRDCAGRNTTIDFNRSKNAKISVDGKSTNMASVQRKLSADQILTIKASLGKVSRTWYVRCLPNDFPKLSVVQHQKSPDALYMLSTGIRTDTGRWQIASPYYVILDQRGAPIWYMRGSGTPAIIDRAANGNLLTGAGANGISPSYAARGEPAFVETTLEGVVVAEHGTPYSDPVDGHSLQVLPNGNMLMMTVPVRTGVDLSDDFAQLQPLDVAAGGVEKCDVTNVKNASVAYPAIRELSPTGKVVWSWNSWDHIDDAESILPALTNIDYQGGVNCVVDLFHGVTASQSPDGRTVILTARFASATWGIDKASGAVMWKIGGLPTEKSLAIVGDPYGKYGPRGHHGGVIDANGRLLVFDNRRAIEENSRGLLYQIDTDTMTATYIRGYVPPQKPCNAIDGQVICSSYSMGFAQFTPTGGALVSWGYKMKNPNVATEFSDSGKPILSILNSGGIHNTYMVLRTPYTSWPLSKLRAAASSKKTIFPSWDSGLPADSSPEDSAVKTIK